MKMVLTARPMTSFALRKNLCKLGWGGSEIFLTIIISKRRSQFTPQYNRGQGVANEFSVIYLLALFSVQLHGESNKADLSCHNTNVSRQRHAVMSASIACKYFSRLNPRVELTTRVYLKAPFLTTQNVKLNLMIGFFFLFLQRMTKERRRPKCVVRDS